MPPVCLYSIIDLPDEALKRMLPRVSTRSLVRLLIAYPRVAGRPFMELLARTMSPPTMEFLREEVNRTQLPTFWQIRQAESELCRLALEEHLFP